MKLKAACQSGKCREELAGTVTSTHSHNLGIWRKLEHTIHQIGRACPQLRNCVEEVSRHLRVLSLCCSGHIAVLANLLWLS